MNKHSNMNQNILNTGGYRSIKGIRILFYALIIALPVRLYAQTSPGVVRAMTILSSNDIPVNRLTVNDNELVLSGNTDEQGAVSWNSVAYLHFNLRSIPENAVITSVSLRLFLKSKMSGGDEQFIKVFDLKDQKTAKWSSSFNWQGQPVSNADVSKLSAIASSKVRPADIGKSINFKLNADNYNKLVKADSGNVFLMLAAGSQQYSYYSSRSDNIRMRPRLVIEYYMLHQLQYSNWSQYKYDAQHTGQLSWQTNCAAKEYKMQELFKNQGANYVSSDPIICNGVVVFNYQGSDEKKFSIKACTENGRQIDELEEQGNSQQLIADRLNNIYLLKGSTGDNIKMIRFNNNKFVPLYTKALPENAKSTTTPVVGFDGSLYLSTDKGLYAYTPFPEFKIKWKYPLDGDSKYGTATLSEDEKTLFVYNGKGRLTAIDNMLGTWKWERQMTGYENNIPVASVRSGKVCITDGYRQGRVFYMLDAATGNKIVTDSGADNTRSQPIIGPEYVYIISDRKLRSYKLSDGKQGSQASPDDLNPASTMVMDKSENIYILSTDGAKHSLTTIPANGQTVVTDASKYGYLKGNSLLVSPGGKLFTRNDNGVYSFIPSSFYQSDELSIASFAGRHLYRANGKIKVDATEILSTQNVIMQSGAGGFTFKEGFRVKEGAQLQVKTGFYFITLNQ
ncbi:MAG: outer membrane protein assembly factor BamB, contains PQQ-like beta-propeller repeat [Flavipsychrobacter sp.]|nr:outer membrane protein assembly factor BamB, contains PQQ-like beta-propeller repeat [Flavipsychrobacter sp.]